ncbi:guanine nucleotide-binding protein subunit beta-like protein 1 isoform X1 [Chiloscyllium plagiosum]|uniref:guanine nucleotide-binding protein subunit beta-like protein 1 isoform X1 n=2 Tax=Chiloscyllium plagiosum TaxID=36176 RepID=UPI001CB7EF08|nr:guanine nucleotide-binding protein subunit beta-like protein 1 isoform X1 [Chiloscyllium plagiosum]
MSDFCDNSMAIPPPDPKFVLRGTGASINTLHFCCSDQEDWNPILFSGSANGQIHIWNLKTHRADKVLESHNKQSVLWIHTLQGRNGLISQGRDAAVSTWDLSEGRTAVIDSIPLDSYGFCQCSLMQEGVGHYLLASPGSTSSEVKILDLPKKTPVWVLKPPADAKLGMPMCLKLWQPPSGSRPLLLVGYENGSLTLWDLSEKKMLSHLACHNEPIMCLDFDPERAKGISGSSEKLLSSWGLDNQQNLKLQNAVTLVNAGIADTCIRQDKKILATAGWDHRIRIFGWKKLKPLAVLQYHIASVHCVTFSDHVVPCERLMAAGSKDQRISLWSVYNKP